MYLDTKNMENVNQTNMTYARLHAAKSKGRMGKVWKPLLRFLSPKSHHTIDSNKKHPNNINLNNANNMSVIVHDMNEEAVELIVELPQKTVHIDKELEEWNQQQKYLQQMSTEKTEEAFIKSASIDKSPTYICQNCIHGRNCQHLIHHGNFEKFQVSDGSEREQTSDEELLNAWYYYNYRQVAVQASLC